MSAGALAVLAGVGCLTPRRLRLLLQHHAADDAVRRLADGSPLHPMCLRGLPPDLVDRLRTGVRAASVEQAEHRCAELGVAVVALGDPAYPSVLAADPEAPAVLFALGDLTATHGRRVGIVGTRHATSSGLATAAELAGALSSAGVAVVSGLARGIDASAHLGVRTAGGPGRAVAVVGSGPDVRYPRQNAELWGWVAAEGLLLSEWPPGIAPDAWRFPLRNRMIAALSELVVVVESRERGGSLITARLAIDRGIDVMAVPGSPRVRASAGANALLVDGATPVTSVDDVLAALSIEHCRAGDVGFDPRPPLDVVQRRIFDVCAAEPSNLGTVVARTGLPVTDAALALARLERDGWLVEAGGWFEPLGSRLRQP